MEINCPPPILLFGATSITGFTLANLFPRIISPFVPPNNKSTWSTHHLEDTTWLKALFAERDPDVVIYCHAVCDVSKCETSPDWAREMNVSHIHRLLDTLPATTRLVYISSDHVFGGNGVYNEESAPCPISIYGQTRVEAEGLILKRKDALVLRIGLAIGPSLNGRTGHSDWLAYRHQRQLPITIIEDEFRSVVWAADLAKRIMAFAQSDEKGLHHIASTKAISRIELANYMAHYLSIDPVFKIASRHQQIAPHLGRVELASLYQGPLHQPLPCVVDCPS
ncbi:MAG: dTDP-4-dehydrorhamnose reductase [Candidatus Latescibacterota bacterium]